jgi:hypothetical protein
MYARIRTYMYLRMYLCVYVMAYACKAYVCMYVCNHILLSGLQCNTVRLKTEKYEMMIMKEK